MVTVAVMGAGSWGTAFSLLCADAGENVVLWSRRPEIAQEINQDHRNRAYLGDIELPARVRATHDAEEALATGSDVVVLAIPSLVLRECLQRWVDVAPRGAIFASLVKGIEDTTRMRASQIVENVLDVPAGRVVVVSGPNLARECAARLPAATVAASTDAHAARRVQRMSHTRSFRVYTNPDVIGVELGGAVKNAIALAAGVADGLGSGDNTKAMLITRGLAEMARLGVAMGGDPITFSGLAGMGDLVATCTSTQSRNRHVGERLARGEALADIVDSMNMVAEGVKSSRGILALAQAHDTDMPIVEHVVQVVHEGVPPVDVVQSLMGREPKAEFHGIPETTTGRGPGAPVGGGTEPANGSPPPRGPATRSHRPLHHKEPT